MIHQQNIQQQQDERDFNLSLIDRRLKFQSIEDSHLSSAPKELGLLNRCICATRFLVNLMKQSEDLILRTEQQSSISCKMLSSRHKFSSNYNIWRIKGHILKSTINLLCLISILMLMQQCAKCDIFCPRDLSHMHPCTCQNGTQGLLIKCSRSNLAILSRSLGNLQGLVEQIEIEDSSVSKVFGPIFKDSSLYRFHNTLRELDVRASGVKLVDSQSFSQELMASLQYFMLDRNHISQIPSDLLNNMTNLRLLNLSANAIASIESNSFVKLTNLTELDLSDNKIGRLQKNSFNGLSSLEVLNLGGNELNKLEKNIFSTVRRLRHLDLSNNKLSTLDRQDLQELTALETLKIANNQLTTLPRSIFSRNAKLYNLDLSFNKLDDIDTYLFKSTRFLKDLNIAGNVIKEITKNTFSPTTRIKRINLAQNQLQALAPETFKGLEYLEYINLSHNQIVNISTDAFSRIYQVEIDLSYNKLSRIFYWSFHEVSNMTRLDLSHNSLDDGVSMLAFDQTDCAHLDLSYNQIQDISKFPVSNLTGLRTLDLQHNQITELNKKSFSEKRPMYELHTIDCSFNNISQISGNIMERLRSIRQLNVSHNSLRRLTSGAFGNSPTLLELDLSHNNLVEIVSGTLVGLISTRTLDLRHNRLKKMIPIPVALNTIHLEHNEIGQLSKSAFPSLNSLLELYLDHNRVSYVDDGTFSTLLALHTLSLSHNNLSQIPLQALKDLAALQTLNLDGNNIQRLQRKAFGTLPIVFNLRLDQNNISSIADHAFEGMLQLLHLNLSHNNLIEVPPEAFANLVSLRSLDLSHNLLNRFENKTRSAMEDLLSLEVANFSHNKLSTITQRTFLNSPYIPYRLTSLDLSYNLIGILVNHFSNGMKKLEWLSLRNNILNEIMPNVLGNITQLKYLDLSHNKLRTLKEQTFSGQLDNLTTILLNNNKLIDVQARELDRLKKLSQLNLASNRLESIFPELNRWIRRGMIVDIRQNNLECSCDQLPLLAWIDSFKQINHTYAISTEQQSTSANVGSPEIVAAHRRRRRHSYERLTRSRMTSENLPQFMQATQLVSELSCSKPESISGKSIMQMLDLVVPSPSAPTFGLATMSSSIAELNCDRELLNEADQMKRLKAPIQFVGAEPYFYDGSQYLRIGWSLHDQHLDIMNFLLLKAKFAQPFDLGSYRTPAYSTTTMMTQAAGGASPASTSATSVSATILKRASTVPIHNDFNLQLVEHEVERVIYSEQALILRNLDPSQFYVVCITYETGNQQQQLASPSQMIEQLNKTTNPSGQSALIASIISDYGRINCASLNSLLQHDVSEPLVSGQVAWKPNLVIGWFAALICQIALISQIISSSRQT